MIRISIIIPAYNEEKSLGTILACIEKQDCDLSQIEVVVVNNNSTDGTEALLKQYASQSSLNIQALCESKPHVNAARNKGARCAQGDTFVFLDADNLIPSDFVTHIYSALRNGDEAGTFTTLACGDSLKGHALFLLMELIKISVGKPFGKSFCSKKVFNAIGGFDENISLGTNLDFLTRVKAHLKKKGKDLKHIPKPVYASLRTFEKEGYLSVIVLWLIAYCGFKQVPYGRFTR